MAGFAGVILLLLAIYRDVHAQEKEYECEVPEHFRGDYYSIDRGQELENQFEVTGFKSTNIPTLTFCKELTIREGTRDAEGNFNARMVFYDKPSNCYVCMDMYYRTPNVLQLRSGSCTTSREDSCDDIEPNSELLTLFRTTIVTVNCKQVWEGTFQFQYEVDYGGGGPCNNEHSYIKACQEPGSPYVDNQVFEMYFAKCSEVADFRTEKIKFQCMGSWRDEITGNIFSAIADLGKEVFRERYKCMLTTDNQQEGDNKKRYVMSRWASCSTLKSIYDGDIRILMKPSIVGMHLVNPSCNLPRNFTGSWFTTGEFDTTVKINDTHIYFNTLLDQFSYKEQVFTCQVNRDSRFLMSVITVGKCEVDYVCFDFMPRHHNIIRWRMGRPFRMEASEILQPDHLQRKFRQACTWSSFTFNRNDINWKYHTFILYPPAPVDCPIGGRYRFQQYGAPAELFRTRVRGITVRPRHMIDCMQYVSEFKSCDNNPKKIFVDAEYCETVDHTGRPIGEYDIADHELNCVGYWMEDMRSYMITYDEEDATTHFRCWVYERLDWRDMILSRSSRASCGLFQTAWSETPEEGASLRLVLKENERIWDECPQRYDTGANPYEKELKIYVLAGSSSITPCIFIITMVTIITQFCHAHVLL